MRTLGPVLADSWRLFKPYFFHSPERRSALALLVCAALLSVTQTEISVLMTFWSNLLYDTFQTKDLHAFLALIFTWKRLPSGWIMPGFLIQAVVYILTAALTLFVTNYLQIRWRSWMTGAFTRRWLDDLAYYRISIASDPDGVSTDNPDQRLSDDIADFCGAGANTRPGDDTLSIMLGLLSSVVSLVSFVAVLWVLSRGVTLFGLRVPGGLDWVALLFSLGGTTITFLVGRRLIPLYFYQQRYEADFRFALVRVRESTEAIALHRSETEERVELMRRLAMIRANFIGLLRRILLLNVTSVSYSQVASVLPQLLIAPLFFAGTVTLGTMIQISQAFGAVQDALSFFATSFTTLARWRTTVGRLATFDRALEAARALDAGFEQRSSRRGAYALTGAVLGLPDGTVLAEDASVQLEAGIDTMISGRSGSGKSTLFRALAGIWPFGRGTLERPPGTRLFLPQRPYIPLGTLRHVLCYPLAEAAVPAEAAAAALRDVELAHLVEALDRPIENWAQRLSGGEQQRLAIARALINQPDWLFLDEATASLDPELEMRMWVVLKRRLPGTTIISIAHNPALAGLHRRHLSWGRSGVAAPGAGPA